jgi:hypothetical protein
LRPSAGIFGISPADSGIEVCGGRAAHRQTVLGGEERVEPLSAASINRPLALLRHLRRLAGDEWGVLADVPR